MADNTEVDPRLMDNSFEAKVSGAVLTQKTVAVIMFSDSRKVLLAHGERRQTEI